MATSLQATRALGHLRGHFLLKTCVSEPVEKTLRQVTLSEEEGTGTECIPPLVNPLTRSS